MTQRGASTFADTPAWRRPLVKQLLTWFDRSARDLPWRRTRDLYAIWVSEVMLQQTQVATVIPYWLRFLERFPKVEALAAAEERDVLRVWEGMGYYRRARQLHAAARQVVAEHGGEIPKTYETIRTLPGIGRYTAGAILSIGLDQRLPILEANSTRVLARLTGYRSDIAASAGQEYLWSVAESILPAKRCGAFNQALMELGSEICTVSSPGCGRCPVASLCMARRHQLVEQIPRPPKRTEYEEVTEVAVVVRERGRVLLRHCQPNERWAGLWDFPRFEVSGNGHKALEEQISAGMQRLVGFDVVSARQMATIKHGVTRFRITLHCYEARRARRSAKVGQNDGNGFVRWVPMANLDAYPLSTTGRKICRLLRE
jgi:A/G-specific adenine glycosylase